MNNRATVERNACNTCHGGQPVQGRTAGAADGSDGEEDDAELLAQEALLEADGDGVKPPPPAHMALQVCCQSVSQILPQNMLHRLL